MEAEMKPGDILLLERTSGAGMTVRYLLPRGGLTALAQDEGPLFAPANLQSGP